jgi:hypothetical protein
MAPGYVFRSRVIKQQLGSRFGLSLLGEEVVVPEGTCQFRSRIRAWARGNRKHTSNRVFSAIILWNPIPTPSITASKHAHPIAEFRAAL